MELIRRRSQGDAKAKAIIEALTAALNDDEHVTTLEQQLATQHRLALQLMEQPVQPVPAPVAVSTATPILAPHSTPGLRQVQRRSVGVSALREALQEVEKALAADPELRADIDCRVYRPGAEGDSNP